MLVRFVTIKVKLVIYVGGCLFFHQKFKLLCCGHGNAGQLELIKLELLQMHTMRREKGNAIESIHKEVIVTIKFENYIGCESSKSRRGVMLLYN